MTCFLPSRQTQWDPPTWDSPGDEASLEHEAEMDLGTPTYDENPMKVRGDKSLGWSTGWEGSEEFGGGRGTEMTLDPLEYPTQGWAVPAMACVDTSLPWNSPLDSILRVELARKMGIRGNKMKNNKLRMFLRSLSHTFP